MVFARKRIESGGDALNILITGGAGFVGSNLVRLFRRDHPTARIVAFDNLKRRGSELNISEFRSLNVEFVHGDIRNKTDFEALKGKFDLFIEASAEPSVHAGADGSPGYLLETNLGGTLNCLEFARAQVHKTIFLSTSRVYSIDALKRIPLEESSTRLSLAKETSELGLTQRGVTEDFSTRTARSLYGASKLASEMICQEYAFTYGTKVLINRCGVIAGPGQFGKVDQGVFTLWVANHVFQKPLRYLGFGGLGKQVRDLLHPEDLYDLIRRQAESELGFDASIYNVGGGNSCSTSLLELTHICQKVTGNKVDITSHPETAAVDIPYYVTDTSHVEQVFNWLPKRSVQDIVSDIYNWIEENKSTLRHIF